MRIHRILATRATFALTGFALTALALMVPSAPSRAADLFEIDVNGGAITASGNDVIELAEELLSQSDTFSSLGGLQTYTASLSYLGIPQAIQFSVSDFGSTVTLDIPTTGTQIVFSGSSPDAVEDQIEDWIRQDGADTWAEFLQSTNAHSPIALLDGNPHSTTALMAGSSFAKFGIDPSEARLRGDSILSVAGFEMRADVGYSKISAGDFDDLSAVQTALTFAGDIVPRVGLSGSVIGQYRDYQGAKSYDLGLELAAPVSILRNDLKLPFAWTVTPIFQTAAGASKELAAGGLFIGGGVVSALAYDIGPLDLLMGNELVYYGGVPIENIGGYDFETEVDQLITKNGLKLTWRPLPILYVDGGSSFTNFLLSKAAVDSYSTPFVGVGVHASRILNVRVDYWADLGDDYTAHNAGLKLDLHF